MHENPKDRGAGAQPQASTSSATDNRPKPRPAYSDQHKIKGMLLRVQLALGELAGPALIQAILEQYPHPILGRRQTWDQFDKLYPKDLRLRWKRLSLVH